MKYRLTDNKKEINGVTLHQIECIEPFGDVKQGELGGWIEKEKNLSQDGNAWVCGNAVVYGNARVYGNAMVCGNAVVYGNARVCDTKDYIVFKNNWSSGRYFTYTKSNNKWKVGCFYGTCEELIEKAYKDSKLSGDCYKATVEYIERLNNIINNNNQNENNN